MLLLLWPLVEEPLLLWRTFYSIQNNRYICIYQLYRVIYNNYKGVMRCTGDFVIQGQFLPYVSSYMSF